MAKRLDTGSPWVIHNNPRGKFFNPSGEGGTTAVPNRDYLLRRLLRASTAAPHYFKPERLHVAEGLDGAFIDGGFSTFKNPALQMLMLATLKNYGFKWPFGAANLLLVSVGTGCISLHLSADKVMKITTLQLAKHALISLLEDCDWLGQTLLQWMSRSNTPWLIDQEIGDLQEDILGGLELLSYVRYNVLLESTWLKNNLGIKLTENQITKLQAMDAPKNVDKLLDLGRKAATIQIQEKHFPSSFDIF
ncbi:MAG: hypothetical protein JXA79_11940 [Deltaproteobacteria bacterium]|nr:hypothetical protein [Deltaproteobacteria bacterium]